MSEHTKEPWRTGVYDEESGWVDLYSDSNDEGLPIGSTRHANSEANARRIVACVNACVGVDTERLEFDYFQGFDPWSYAEYLKEKLEILSDAIDEIALAGMSVPLSMAMQEDEVQAFHARRAWEFIRIAAVAKDAINQPAKAEVAHEHD